MYNYKIVSPEKCNSLWCWLLIYCGLFLFINDWSFSFDYQSSKEQWIILLVYFKKNFSFRQQIGWSKQHKETFSEDENSPSKSAGLNHVKVNIEIRYYIFINLTQYHRLARHLMWWPNQPNDFKVLYLNIDLYMRYLLSKFLQESK